MNFLRNAREWATPQLKDSAFLERGVLTPEEFVAAGDQLVYRCPTWSWASGEPSRVRPYLPADKQYLVTKGVPCRQRVVALDSETYETLLTEAASGEGGGGGDDEWVATHMAGGGGAGGEEEELEVIGGDDGDGGGGKAAAAEAAAAAVAAVSLSDSGMPPAAAAAVASPLDEEDYEDLADFEDEDLVADGATLAVTPSAGQAAGEEGSKVVKTRTYDLSITYDKYYQTPRMWLFGYDERNQPLTEEQVFEDVMQDYAQRTVTVDPHPHLGTPHASVHPCKHAQTMKRIVDALSGGDAAKTAAAAAGEGKEAPAALSTNSYLFIFLKFIGSVVPTIEYDFTFATAARK